MCDVITKNGMTSVMVGSIRIDISDNTNSFFLRTGSLAKAYAARVPATKHMIVTQDEMIKLFLSA